MRSVQPDASHFVAGAPLEDCDGATLDCVYPATGAVVARVHAATPGVIERALAAADAARGAWASMSGSERGRILREAARIIRARNRDLSEIESIDTGKPIRETLVADAASGADALDYFAGLAPTVAGEHLQFGNGDFGYTIREPIGLCVGIGAWNYPTQIACWKAAPALACGNTMVFKPSELTPLGALKLAEILTEAGLPPGVFNVVQGGAEVGHALVTDPRVAKVSLTGSVPTGRKVYAAAADGIRAVTMELGGKSPLIVFADADLDSAVSGAINGNFFSSGQVCSNGTRVCVERGLRDRFVARLVERLSGVVMGDALDEATNFGPLISERQVLSVLDHIRRGVEDGARLVHGGRRADRPGFFVEPTVFTDVADDMALAREEIFGPVMSILDFDDEDEVVARANATPYGLAAGVFTRDMTRAQRMVARIDAGTTWINTYNLTPVGLPFGGTRMSGIGRENSRAAIEHYTRLKSVYVAAGPCAAAY